MRVFDLKTHQWVEQERTEPGMLGYRLPTREEIEDATDDVFHPRWQEDGMTRSLAREIALRGEDELIDGRLC